MKTQTPFEERCHDAVCGARPGLWYLINTLEGNCGATEIWAERLGPGEPELLVKRWENLRSLYALLLSDDATEEIGKAFGERSDRFAEWLGCEPALLLHLLAGHSWHELDNNEENQYPEDD